MPRYSIIGLVLWFCGSIGGPVKAQAPSGIATLQLELEWAVGHENSPSILDEPRMALFGMDGTAFLVERKTEFVRRFDTNGVEMDQLGVSGAGPGEFSDIRSLHLSASGDLLVFDLMKGSVLVFDQEGRYATSIEMGALRRKSMDLINAGANSDGWVVLYQSGAPKSELKNLVHRFSPESGELGASAIHPEDVMDLGLPLHAFRAHNADHYEAALLTAASGSKAVAVTAGLYTGLVGVAPLGEQGFGDVQVLDVPKHFKWSVGKVLENSSDAPRGTTAQVVIASNVFTGRQTAMINIWATRVVSMPENRFAVTFIHADEDEKAAYLDLFSLELGFEDRFKLEVEGDNVRGPVRVWDSDGSGRLLVSFHDKSGNPVLARTKPTNQ